MSIIDVLHAKQAAANIEIVMWTIAFYERTTCDCLYHKGLWYIALFSLSFKFISLRYSECL